MTTPTDHYLNITLPDGKTVRATITYLQPKAERWRESTAVVHVECSEWLEPYWHAANYTIGNGLYSDRQAYKGKYLPHRYKIDARGVRWLFEGTFNLDDDTTGLS